ncbi:hypothetical protein WR25_19289 [Diploscapter pachys]|uniref:Uncharacterized protein n=1 Tax=Diploscapter pachys TaxID=2018661 RepID=A0A2A2JUM4_9BILA|nr:hypothetical protein WR25_19289 [Diploscapter pachys]
MSESSVVRDSKATTVSLSKDSEALATFSQAQSGSTSVEMNTEKNGEGLPVIGEYLEKIAYHANDMCEVLMDKKKQESLTKQPSTKSTRSMAVSKREKTEQTSKELSKNIKIDETQRGVFTDGKEPGDSETPNKELGQTDNPTASLAARNSIQKRSVFSKLSPANLEDLFAPSPDVTPAHTLENKEVKKNKSSQVKKGGEFPVFRPHEYVSEKFERVSKPPANEIDKKEHKHHRNHLPAAIPPTN